MSSIATFYSLFWSKHAEFIEAHRTEKAVTYKRTLFGTKKITTVERWLWEYLDAECASTEVFPYSGFVFTSYFFMFAYSKLPKEFQTALEASSIDEHYYVFPSDLAAKFAEYLQTHPPDETALSAFASEEEADPEFLLALRETHDILLQWLKHIGSDRFGVIHLSF